MRLEADAVQHLGPLVVGERHVLERERLAVQPHAARAGRTSSGVPRKSQMTLRHTSMREIWPPACANFSSGAMKPSGMTMHVRNIGSVSWPADMSHTPSGSDTSSVHGTTDLTAPSTPSSA